jgi:hypothetical protein
MASTHFDDDWKAWIATNIARGCSRDGIFRILVDSGSRPVYLPWS